MDYRTNKIIGKIQLRKDSYSQTIEFPKDGKVMSIQYQNGIPCMWVHGDFTKLGPAIIYAIPTGQHVEYLDEPLYIGTLQDGPFVWHYFLRLPEGTRIPAKKSVAEILRENGVNPDLYGESKLNNQRFENDIPSVCPIITEEGQGYITSVGFIIAESDRILPHITFERIEPVDEELEAMKAKFPANSYFKINDSFSPIFKVAKSDIERDSRFPEVINIPTYDGNNFIWFNSRICTPFPLPTWRCCVSDKPKESGYYYLRSKDRKWQRLEYFSSNESFARNEGWGELDITNLKWLDEGEL